MRTRAPGFGRGPSLRSQAGLWRPALRAAGILVAALAAVAAAAGPAAAHSLVSTAVLVTVHQDQVDLTIEMPLSPYAAASGSSVDVNGANVQAHADEIGAYVVGHVSLSDAQGPLDLSVAGITASNTGGLPGVVVEVVATPADGTVDGNLTLHYSLIIDTFATHSAYVSLVSDWEGGVVTDEHPRLLTILDKLHQDYTYERGRTGWWSGAGSTLRLGVSHIANGPDHVLFLLMLLLPVPLVAGRRRWNPHDGSRRAGARAAVRKATTLVSSFTVGHTVSLALVSTHVLALPGRLTESLVALSIVAAALHAMVPLVRRAELWTAAGFGLVHGTAFAATLVNLNLPGPALAIAILTFNLGVEFAQLVVVVATLPALMWAAKSPWYQPTRWVLAVAGAAAGSAWVAGVVTGHGSILAPAFAWLTARPLAFYAMIVALAAVVAEGPRVVGAVRALRPAARRTR